MDFVSWSIELCPEKMCNNYRISCCNQAKNNVGENAHLISKIGTKNNDDVFGLDWYERKTEVSKISVQHFLR